MKHAKLIFMVLIMMLICCSNSIGQPSSGIGGTVPLGTINSGANVYPLGIVNSGASFPTLWEFVCNSMSACGTYPYGKSDNGDSAIVDLGGVKSGAIVSL